MSAPDPEPPNAVDAELAALIVDNAVEYAIFTMDTDGRVTSWSRGAERILGYGRDEAMGLNASVIFTAPDRAAGVDDAELRVALESGRVEDSRWHLRRDQSRFWANGVTMRFRREGRPALLKILRDETPAKLAEQQRVLLLNELNHRVKNTLATVQSISDQTLRAGHVDTTVRRTLTERLIALSDAHDVLLQENWAGADLGTILDQALAPHAAGDRDRFTLDGPSVRLSPQQAVSVSLVLHELTTNALKYGALSTGDGQVSVSWNIAQDGAGRRHLTLLWRETGGPPVVEPDRKGFGSRLIERSFEREGNGRAVLRYDPDGVVCTVTLQLSGAEEIPILDVRQDG